MPAEPLVVEFFTKKENEVVKWIKNLQYHCVVAPNTIDSMIEIYSTDRNQAVDFCKKIRSEIDSLTIDASLSEMVSEINFSQFVHQLYSDEDIVFKESQAGLKICGFKEKRDQIYTAFLDFLPINQ